MHNNYGCVLIRYPDFRPRLLYIIWGIYIILSGCSQRLATLSISMETCLPRNWQSLAESPAEREPRAMTAASISGCGNNFRQSRWCVQPWTISCCFPFLSLFSVLPTYSLTAETKEPRGQITDTQTWGYGHYPCMRHEDAKTEPSCVIYQY